VGDSGAGPGSDALAGPEPRRGAGGRRQHAGFSIFLDQVADDSGQTHWETRLYHAESGAETILPSASPDEWIAWVLERIGSSDVVRAGPEANISAPSVEVATVEITDVKISQAKPDRDPSLHTITAQLVVQLTGVAGFERAIGSKILRGIAASKPASAREGTVQSD